MTDCAAAFAAVSDAVPMIVLSESVKTIYEGPRRVVNSLTIMRELSMTCIPTDTRRVKIIDV